MADFKDRLRQLREEKGLTQDKVADYLKITKSAVSGWERGERHPRFDMLDDLADLLDVNVNYLMGSTDKRQPYPRMTPEEQDRIGAELIQVDISSEELELVRAYRRLDEYAKKIIRMTARMEE